MSLQLLFLGTAGSIPTRNRALPALLIQRKGEYLIFDCGEGIQRQMIKAKVGFGRKMKVFISHLHGDHVLGLPGLLQTMALLDRKLKVEIYGPPGIKQFFEALYNTVQFALTFPIEINEILETGKVYEDEEYVIQAIWGKHIIPNLIYALVEKIRPGKFFPEIAKNMGVPEGPLWSRLQKGENIKLANGREVKSKEILGLPRLGRKIVYTGDTRPFSGLVKFSVGADVLIHEATFDDNLSQRANKDGHSTPSQAAKIALKAKVKQLILTHISARYQESEILLKQAQKIFKNTLVAEDFTRIEVPLKKE